MTVRIVTTLGGEGQFFGLLTAENDLNILDVILPRFLLQSQTSRSRTSSCGGRTQASASGSWEATSPESRWANKQTHTAITGLVCLFFFLLKKYTFVFLFFCLLVQCVCAVLSFCGSKKNQLHQLFLPCSFSLIWPAQTEKHTLSNAHTHYFFFSPLLKRQHCLFLFTEPRRRLEKQPK